MSEFQKKVFVSAAWDKRDPNPHKNYGVHGCEIYFQLIGPNGAVHFALMTNWQLDHVQAEWEEKNFNIAPIPATVGFHSPKPRAGHAKKHQCDLLEGGHCYYGSISMVDGYWKVLREEGSDGLWKKLEEAYHANF